MSAEATQIRDTIYEIVAGLGLLRAMRVVPTFQWQPEDAPACGVYLRRERMAPDGDITVGAVKFVNSATLGVNIIAKARSPEELTDVATQYGDLIEAAILTSDDLFGGQLVEGVESVDRTAIYPSNGSAYWAEIRIEFDFQFRSSWPPEIVDNLRHIILTTRPAPADPDTPAITTRIDLPGP